MMIPLQTGSPLRRGLSLLLAYVRSGEPDLTSRQMALLRVLQLEKGAHTIRNLAARLVR
jgi:hypothetical protein